MFCYNFMLGDPQLTQKMVLCDVGSACAVMAVLLEQGGEQGCTLATTTGCPAHIVPQFVLHKLQLTQKMVACNAGSVCAVRDDPLEQRGKQDCSMAITVQ